MSRLKWIESLSRGHIEEHIQTLSLTNGYNDKYTGSGELNWTITDGAHLRAITDGAWTVAKSNFISRGRPGQLIPKKEFYTLNGTTVDKWSIHADWISQSNITSFLSHGTTLWDTPISKFEISNELEKVDKNKSSGVAFIQQTNGLEWVRESEIEDRNPRFGGTSSQKDWLEIELADCIIGIRRQAENSAILRIDSLDSEWKPFPEILEAAILATSFVAGQNLVTIGYDYRDSQGHHLGCCRQAQQKKNRISPPLGRGIAGFVSTYEGLIGLAIQFFLTSLGDEIANHLYQCWSSLDNPITIQAIVVCTSIEGVFKRIAETEKQISVTGILKKLSEQNLLQIGEPEVNAWKQIRHHVAHGNLLWHSKNESEKQGILDNFEILKNLLNMLVLQCIGYNGRFFHYGEHELRDFAPCEMNELKASIS